MFDQGQGVGRIGQGGRSRLDSGQDGTTAKYAVAGHDIDRHGGTGIDDDRSSVGGPQFVDRHGGSQSVGSHTVREPNIDFLGEVRMIQQHVLILWPLLADPRCQLGLNLPIDAHCVPAVCGGGELQQQSL